MPAERDVVVRAVGLTVSFGDVTVLENLEFSVRRGEFVAVVGRSGTGKSTLLNAIAGFVEYSGEVLVPRRSLGYVFQDYALFPWLTVEGNVAFGLAGVARMERRRRVEEILDRIEMREFRTRYPNELSGGQVQRVALARSLAPEPDVVLMDEPYAALDYHTRERMQAWLLSVWADTGSTIVFVTHNIEEAVFLADRVLVLRKGRIVANVDVSFHRPRSDEVRYTDLFLSLKHQILDCMENGA